MRRWPRKERRQLLENFLVTLEEHPTLVDFRDAVPAGPPRQLALFAAMERHVFRGSRVMIPPEPGDQIDEWLCDILDALDDAWKKNNPREPLSPDRHKYHLQAGELFTAVISQLSRAAVESSLVCEANLSPVPQDSVPNGELIGPQNVGSGQTHGSSDSPQVEGALCVASVGSDVIDDAESASGRGIIHHEGEAGSEEIALVDPACRAGSEGASGAGACELRSLPAEGTYRAVRRGRPPMLDDTAKGRVLGLMAYGLSYRQAAGQIGVHHTTILSAMRRDEQFAQQMAEARLDAISQPLMTVVKASRTSWRAAAWLAKYLDQRPWSLCDTTPEERELAKR